MTRVYLSYAKFNLYLAVLGRRADGYHEIDTVLQTVDLADRITFEVTAAGNLTVTCEDPEVPAGEQNLVYRALERLRSASHPRAAHAGRGMRVRIEKRIPAEAGLGGGSSNAACALVAGNRLWDLGLSEEALESLGAELGSDVPFFIRGGTQRSRGRGERLSPLPALPASSWIVVKPPWANPTWQVYQAVRSALTPERANIRIILQSLAKRDLAGIVETAFNDLEEPARALQPEAGAVADRMFALGLTGVRLAGSGSAYVGYCPVPELAGRIQREGRRRGWRVFPIQPMGRGCCETQSQ
jgi:4-diphosphocytidyl-2-C-methyl-D-erythritol kinase